MEKSVLDRRLAQMEAEGTRFRSGVDVGVDVTGPAAARPLRRGRPRRSAPPCRATCRSPGASSTASSRRWTSCRPANRVALGEPVGGQITRRGQGRHRHRRRRHRRRLPRHRAPPGRRVGHQPGDHARSRRTSARPHQPWPTYPMIFRVAAAHEEGGDRGCTPVAPSEFVGDEHGRRPGAAAARGRHGRRTASRRSRAPSARSRPQLVLLAMGFLGPQRRGLSTSSASSSTGGATSRATTPS